MRGSTGIVTFDRLAWPTGTARPRVLRRFAGGAAQGTRRITEILLVEEDLATVNLVCRALDEPEFRVQLACRSEHAVFEISKKPFDLVILDLGRSGMRGL